MGFKWILRYFRWIFAEFTRDRPRQHAYEIKLMLSRVSWALAQIPFSVHCAVKKLHMVDKSVYALFSLNQRNLLLPLNVQKLIVPLTRRTSTPLEVLPPHSCFRLVPNFGEDRSMMIDDKWRHNLGHRRRTDGRTFTWFYILSNSYALHCIGQTTIIKPGSMLSTVRG